MIDLHCHILPGVDDGPVQIEESLAMARQAYADGIRTLVATPHLLPQHFDDHAWIQEGVTRLNAVLAEQDLALQVLPGAEVVAAPEVLAHARNLPRLGSGSCVLLEVPLIGLPNYLEEVVFALQLAGVRPVLAHPERSQLIRAQPEVIQRLAERGCVLQINGASLLGRAGRAERRIALGLLRDYPDCVVASDAHDALYRPPVLSPARRAFVRLGAEARFREVVHDLPAKLLAG